MTKKKNSTNIVKTMVGTMIGMGMLGATAGMAISLPAGTAKNIAGVVPGLQAVSLVSYNIKPIKKVLGKQKGLSNSKSKKSLW